MFPGFDPHAIALPEPGWGDPKEPIIPEYGPCGWIWEINPDDPEGAIVWDIPREQQGPNA